MSVVNKFSKTPRSEFASFFTRKEASAFAKKHSWGPIDVFLAANNFQSFWVVGQVYEFQGDGNLYKLLTNSGSTIIVKSDGWVSA